MFTYGVNRSLVYHSDNYTTVERIACPLFFWVFLFFRVQVRGRVCVVVVVSQTSNVVGAFSLQANRILHWLGYFLFTAADLIQSPLKWWWIDFDSESGCCCQVVDIICPSPSPPPSPYLDANPIAGNWVSLFSFLNAVWINCSVCQNLVSGDLKPRHNCCTTLCHWAGNRQDGSGQVNDQLSKFWVKKKKKRNFELQLHGSAGPPSWFSFISRTVNKWRR
jgi:hypothetical protein